MLRQFMDTLAGELVTYQYFFQHDLSIPQASPDKNHRDNQARI